MKCELCKKTVRVNYGNAYHIFCQECSTKDTAQQAMKSNNGPPEGAVESIDIPFRTTMITIVTIIVAFSVILFLSYQLNKYFDALLILVGLAAIVIILLVKNIIKDMYYRKIINNSIIARSVKNKVNMDLLFGIILIATSIVFFFAIENQLKESYDYLWQEKYIYHVSQMFSPVLLSNLESYAYESENLKLLITITQIQNRMASLLNFSIMFILGFSQLYSGINADVISDIGILTRGKMLKWEEFSSYSWSGCYGKQTFKNSTEYYDLELAHKNGKIITYILKKKESPIILKIRAEDKDKVNKFLLGVIAN